MEKRILRKLAKMRSINGNDRARFAASIRPNDVVIRLQQTAIAHGCRVDFSFPKRLYQGYLTMRMSMRRFTRLTNAFSKKIDNHIHALALYFVWYNFCRLHKAHRVTPAMAAGLTDKVMDVADIVSLIDAHEAERSRKAA